MKQQKLFKLLFYFYRNHFLKLNHFLDNILYYYVYFLSYKEIISNILNNKSVFNSALFLYYKKLFFIGQFNFFFMDYLNSFCSFDNLSLFCKENKMIKWKNTLHFLTIQKRSSFHIFFIKKYFKYKSKKRQVNIKNSSFFLFFYTYIKKRTVFLSYLNNTFDFFFELNVLYFDVLIYNRMRYFSYNNIYFFFNSFFTTKPIYIQNMFLIKTDYFDLYNFVKNYNDRILFSFDYVPFLLFFLQNVFHTRLMCHFRMVFFLWYEISVYWTHILDTEWKYYGPYKQIILKYKVNIPFFNGRTIQAFHWNPWHEFE